MSRIATVLCVLSLLLGQSAAQASSPGIAAKETADAWADLGNWKRAVEHYQKAVQLDPNLHQARLGLADGLARLGRKQSALKHLEKLSRAQPKSARVAAAEALVWLDSKKPEKACQLFAKALTIDSRHGRSLFGSGQCHQAIYEHKKKDQHRTSAIGHFRKYLEYFPRGAFAGPAKDSLDQLKLGAMGALLAQARDAMAHDKFRLAEKNLSQIVAKQPDLEEAHYLHGLALASPVIDRIDDAQEAFERAPKVAQARYQLGLLAYEDGSPHEAQEHLEAAIALDSSLPGPHYHLGLVYNELRSERDAKKQKYQQKAERCFKKVITLSPKSRLARRASSKLQLMSGQISFLAESDVIDTASEVALGRKLTRQIEARFGLLKDQKLQTRLNGILRKVAAHSERLPGALPYKIKVLNVDGINALSFTGGTIYLYKGLLDFIRLELGDADDALAMVIAHEVVHVDRRHGLGMLNLVGGAQALMSGHSMNVRSLNTLMKGMSRRHEFEADQLGTLYAYRAGYKPATAYRFHRRMIATGHEVPDGLDHPTHLQRASQLKEYLLGLRAKARHFEEGLLCFEQGEYEDAVRHLEVFLGVFPNNLPARNNLGAAMHHLAMTHNLDHQEFRLSTDIDPRARIRKVGPVRGDFSVDRALMLEAAELFKSILKRHPQYPAARTNLGACLLALDKTEQAMQLFEQVLAENPKDSPARCNLAVAYLLSQKENKAQELLEHTIASAPRFSPAHFNLAKLHQGAGRKSLARKHYQKVVEQEPKSGWAAQAQSQLNKLK